MAGYQTLRRKRPVVARIPLTHPIMVAGEEVSELGLSRPTLGDLRHVDVGKVLGALQKLSTKDGEDIDMAALPGDVVDMVLRMLPAMAALRPEEAESVDIADLWAILPEVLGFFADFPVAPTG